MGSTAEFRSRSSSISPPISYGNLITAGINSINNNSRSLRACMEANNLLDGAERKALRQRALALVFKECSQWAADCAGYESNGQLILHGSYALDSHLRSSDIDAIFVGPLNLRRYSFMVDMPWRLQNMKCDGKNVASNIMPIHAARFPILKFRMFDAVDIDLQYCESSARTVRPNIREVWTSGDVQMHFKDDAVAIPVINSLMYMIAYNGSGVEQAEFSLALRAIKFWAQKQVLDAKGTTGPRDAVSLMRHMFQIFGTEWHWPQPLFLPPIPGRATAGELVEYENRRRSLTALSFGGNLPPSFGLMPIMTPMCATKEPVDVITSPLDWVRITTAMKAACEELKAEQVNWEKFLGL